MRERHAGTHCVRSTCCSSLSLRLKRLRSTLLHDSSSSAWLPPAVLSYELPQHCCVRIVRRFFAWRAAPRPLCPRCARARTSAKGPGHPASPVRSQSSAHQQQRQSTSQRVRELRPTRPACTGRAITRMGVSDAEIDSTLKNLNLTNAVRGTLSCCRAVPWGRATHLDQRACRVPRPPLAARWATHRAHLFMQLLCTLWGSDLLTHGSQHTRPLINPAGGGQVHQGVQGPRVHEAVRRVRQGGL